MLSQHPANLLLRWILLIVALVAIGQWAWAQVESPPQPPALRLAFTLGLPLLAALIWFLFRSPDEPVPGPRPIIPVPGSVRMALEMAVFLTAVWALLVLGRLAAALAFAIGVALHYFWSADRVIRLTRRR